LQSLLHSSRQFFGASSFSAIFSAGVAGVLYDDKHSATKYKKHIAYNIVGEALRYIATPINTEVITAIVILLIFILFFIIFIPP